MSVEGSQWGYYMAENMRNVGTGKRAAKTKVGLDHIHTSLGKLVIGPDIDCTFFALGQHLVREKSDLRPFFF